MLMKSRDITFNDEARAKILAGVNILADAVQATLGPRGQAAIIEMPYQAPIVTKDGITVARWISVAEPTENLGVQMLKEAAARTAEAAGDGTTTATVLGRALFAGSHKLIAAGAAPIELKRGIDRGVEFAVKHLEIMARPVTDEEVAKVATISANGDSEIGGKIAEAVSKVGRDGVVTIEDGKSYGLELELVDGVEIDNGFISPYFVTNPERMVAEMDSPKGVKVLLVDREITSLTEMLSILNYASNEGIPLLIIAHDVSGEALSSLVINRVKNNLSCAAVKAAGFGANRREELEDLAALTGAKVLGGIGCSEDLDQRTDPSEVLGTARRVTAGRSSTTVVGLETDEIKEAVTTRTKNLRGQVESMDSDFEKDFLRERAAHLEGGVAVIRVGAASDIEMKERKDRVDDALSATKAAVDAGIVPGGGVALLRCAAMIKQTLLSKMDGDQVLGAKLLMKALEEPACQIATNAQASVDMHPEVVLHLIRDNKLEPYGLNAATGEFGNLYDLGVIDPLSVVRSALQHAASVATTMMTASVAIVENRDDDPGAPPMPPIPGGMGGF